MAGASSRRVVVHTATPEQFEEVRRVLEPDTRIYAQSKRRHAFSTGPISARTANKLKRMGASIEADVVYDAE